MSALPYPPAWAELLVTLFAPARRQDSVVGDLLEEYREAQLPRYGKAAADRWFGRHALGFLWRVAMPWAMALALEFAAQDVIDAVIPATSNFHFRSALSGGTLALATYASAGLVTGWRCGRIVAGTAVALFMTALATALSVIEALTLSALFSAGVFQWAATVGRLREALDLPLFGMLLMGVPLSCLAAAIGKAARYVPRAGVR